MASSRLARITAGALMLLAAGVICDFALASCGSQPGPSTLTSLQKSYFGRIGQVNQPFLVANDFVELSPAGCATGTSFDAASPPRTVLVLDQSVAGTDSSGKPRKPSILIIEPDADKKKCKDLVKACNGELSAANLKVHDVECIAASQVVLSSTLLRLAIPDVPQKIKQPTGRARIAVRDKTKATGCDLLVGNDACSKLGAGSGGWHVCADDLFESASCSPNHPTFPTLTMLPPWNDFKKMCFEKHCELDPKRTLQYAIDSDGNMLVPVNWSTLLAVCPGNPPACDVSGALVAPNGTKFDLPVNSSLTQSAFLESFTQAGEPNAPTFIADFSVPKGVAAVVGRTDMDFSVLRIHSTAEQCFEDGTKKRTGKRCEKGGKCPQGTSCHGMCVGGQYAGDQCDDDAPCAGGRCRTAHDIKYSNKTGQWLLERKAPGICQAYPVASTCKVPNECSSPSVCVEYQLRAVDPSPPPGPVAAPTPEPGLVEAFAKFIESTMAGSLPEFVKQLAENAGNLRIVRSSEGAWVAGYLAPSPAERHAADGGRDLAGIGSLVLARSNCGNGGPFCDAIPVLLREPMVPEGVAFVGLQLRVLTREPSAKAGTAAEKEQRTAVLWVLDPSHGSRGASQEPVRVGRVVLGNPGYDPLRDPSGGTGTRYLSPAGRCFLGETPLGVPSYCRPDMDDCPALAICREQNVVVAIDLRSDQNGDGIPDVLQQRAP